MVQNFWRDVAPRTMVVLIKNTDAPFSSGFLLACTVGWTKRSGVIGHGHGE
jgi:hypothetical protein